MAEVPVPGHQAFWTKKRKTLKAEFQRLVGQYPDAEAQLRQLFKVLCDIEDVAGYTSASVGESQDWNFIVRTVERNRVNYCKARSGKTLYSALYGAYMVTLNKLKGMLNASIFSEEKGTSKGTGEPHQEEGFQKVRRRKRQNTGKAGRPPPIILKAKINLIHLQKQLKNVVQDDFEFRTTRNGTRVITKGMADFEAV
jgi:hypothetical protein